MPHALVRRRSRDGLVEIVPDSEPLTLAERNLAIFCVMLAAMVLYVSTLLPAWVFAVVLGYCVAAGLMVAMIEAGVLQPPKAPVHALSRWRPGPGSIA